MATKRLKRPRDPIRLGKHISTSYVERQNLTMRMSMKRFARLSNGFSRKAENHAHSVAINFMHYIFVRIDHKPSGNSYDGGWRYNEALEWH